MTVTANLKPYAPRAVPTVPGGEALFLKEELQRVSQAMALLVQAIQAMDARLITHSI